MDSDTKLRMVAIVSLCGMSSIIAICITLAVIFGPH